MSGNGRFVYNQLLAWIQEVYRTTGHNVINRQALCARITKLKGEYPFLKLSHVHTLQTKADDLIVAYRRFFRRAGGYPRFKSKRQARQTFRYKSGVW
jgi:putative transposase